MFQASSVSTVDGCALATAGAPALAVIPAGIVMDVMLKPSAGLTAADVPVVANVKPAPNTTSLQTGVTGMGIPTGSGSTWTVTVNGSPKQPVPNATGTIV